MPGPVLIPEYNFQGNTLFLGQYVSEPVLEAAHPSPAMISSARINPMDGDPYDAYWDDNNVPPLWKYGKPINPVIQNLQDVTTEGAVTTDPITVRQVIVNKSAPNEEFEFTERGVNLDFPVPMIRPTTPDKPVAFDIVPHGTPADFNGNGVAWLDICNADLKGVNVAASCFRAGVSLTQIMMGSLSFNGAPIREFVFLMGSVNVNDIAGKIKTDRSLEWNNNIKITSPTNMPTIITESDVAIGTFAAFPSNLAYDNGLFADTVRMNAELGHLVMQASNAGKSILFIAGGAKMSEFLAFEIKPSGILSAKKTPVFADDAAAGAANPPLQSGDWYKTPSGSIYEKN